MSTLTPSPVNNSNSSSSSSSSSKPMVGEYEKLKDVFEKCMVNPKLCTHLLGRVNQVNGRFQLCHLTPLDLQYLTESLTTQFYRFAYEQEGFLRMSSKRDQSLLLETNAPLFSQLILCLALNAEDGFMQINLLLADSITHTKSMLQGSICRLGLSDFVRMTTLFGSDAVRETYYAATLAKLRNNSALGFSKIPILAALILFWRGGMAMEFENEVDQVHTELLNMCFSHNPRITMQDYVECQNNLHFMSTLFSL